jgi:hypothetical protein
MDKDKDNATQAIHALIDKYHENKYMYPKVNNYICNQLSNIFENMNESHNQRVTRINELTSEHDNFIQSFLHNNQYFYSTSTDNFFYYDAVHYQLYNEDDILHQVLSSISRDGALMSWKQKTKLNIMKRIRETNLLQTIPESVTIQNVIDNLCPLVFSTRKETKHFLTILGDNIFRKNTSLIYYIAADAKFFLRQLNNISQMLIGCNISQTFKYKYHDHKYEDCRIVKINSSIKYDATWSKILNPYVLDIICVACHYSMRYNSADEYVENFCNDTYLQSSVFYIKRFSIDELVDKFVEDILDIDENANAIVSTQLTTISGNLSQIRVPQVTWKNMQYLWKQFLTDNDLPSVIFLHGLKTMLIQRLSNQYNADLDSYMGVCSTFLPAINTFLNFWNETMVDEDLETDLEIEEIIILFRKWCEINNEMVSQLTDKQMLDLISYYYPTIEVERDKYITHVRCTMWDKQMDIQIAMDNMKSTIRNEYTISNDIDRVSSPCIYRNISIYDAYLYYSKYTSIPVTATPSTHVSSRRQIASKAYFEKYIFDNYQEYIIESKFISSDWYML